MLIKELIINREHVQDYEIIVREIARKKLKLFGLTVFTSISDVTNTNTNTQARRQIGLRQATKEEENEKSD